MRTASSVGSMPILRTWARAISTCGSRRSAGRMVIGSSRPSTSRRSSGSAGTGGVP